MQIHTESPHDHPTPLRDFLRQGPRVSPWSDDSHQGRGEQQDEWVLTYIDMLTLLLTLFVLLLAYSTFKSTDEETPVTFDDQVSRQAVVEPAAAERRETSEELARRLRGMIEERGLGDQVGVSWDEDTVKVEIGDRVLFAQGSAELRAAGFRVLGNLVPMFGDLSYPVSVEGHTDDIPIATARFPSNWELSAGRAGTVVRFLVERGLDSGRLTAIGRADTDPVASNETAAGRARNRRVVMVIRTAAP